MIHEEFVRLFRWQERHRRLVSRLLLVFAATFAIDIAGAAAAIRAAKLPDSLAERLQYGQ